MRRNQVESDQSLDCSDGLESEIDSLSPHKKSLAAQPGSFHRSAHPPRFSHRTVPPLWQTRMQVRTRPGAWSQVLPVCQLSRSQTTARLRSRAVPEASHPVPRELPETEDPPRRHLRHQSRTATEEGGAVTDGWLTHEGYHRRCPGHRNHTRRDAARSSRHGRGLRDRSTGGHR